MGFIRHLLFYVAAGLLMPLVAHANHDHKIDIGTLSTPRVDLFDTGEGLPNLTLLSISATNDGFIWAGTMHGLARYNGLRFVPVELPGEHGTPSIISAVLAINKNQVWVAPANNGVFLWNGQKWKHFTAGREFPDYDVRRFRAFNTRNGLRIYATTNNGIIAIWDGQHWAELKVNFRLRGKEIFDVLLQSGKSQQEDILWIATYNNGLIRCQSNLPCTNILMTEKDRLFEISSLSSNQEKDGSISIWAGSYGGGVSRLNKNKWQQFTAKSGELNSDYVHDLLTIKTSASESELWVATRNGLSNFKNGHWQQFESNTPLLGMRVRGLSASQNYQGHPQLWAATDDGAARLHLKSDWRTVRRLSENGNGVWSVLFESADDGTERLWLGSDGDGLWRYDNKHWTRFGLEDGLSTNIVRSIIRPNNGPLWLGLWNGHIVEQDGERFRNVETPWSKNDQQAISVFLNDRQGGVWVGLRHQGVAHYSGKQWQWFDSKTTGAPDYVLGLSQTGTDVDPVIWATSKVDGLCRFYQQQWRCFNTWNSELPDNRLITVNAYSDAQNRPILWIGTQTQGLIRVDVTNINRPRLVHSPKLPKPPHPYVYGAVQNSRGDIVVCSDYGVAFWKKMNANEYNAINYHRADGLPHDECNAGALSFDRYDRAWIGTIGGAAVLSPESMQQAKAKLNLVHFLINKINQNLQTGTMQFNSVDALANIDLEVALFTGERESESRYRTQLIGLDKEPGPWLQNNQRSFSNVPSGQYVLKIEAKDFAGRFAKPLEIELSIPTPWWRSWWARTLMVLTMVGFLLLFIRWRERQLRIREGQLITLVDQRTGQLERRGKELHQMNEELRRLSYRDTLTDIANRRKLLELLDSAWQDAQQTSTSVAFILLDADDFKAINDNYGHIRGDECLQLIAKQLELSLKDIACALGRYGGEEFGIVLPDCTIENAIMIAEQCRIDIEKLKLLHAYSTYGIVTVSLGVACITPTSGETSESIIAKADTALYRAKLLGKNRIELVVQSS